MAKFPSLPKPDEYQESVVQERDRATGLLESLTAYIGSEAFDALDDKPKVLAERQKQIMHDYVAVLNARIALF